MRKTARSTPRSPQIRGPCALPAQAGRSFRPSDQWKVSTWPSHRNARALKFSFEVGKTMQAKVKDGGREGCVGSAALKDFDKGLRIATAAGGDHGNVQRLRTCTRQLAIEAGAGAITIYGG